MLLNQKKMKGRMETNWSYDCICINTVTIESWVSMEEQELQSLRTEERPNIRVSCTNSYHTSIHRSCPKWRCYSKTKDLLCAKYCSGLLRYINEQNRQPLLPLPWRLYSNCHLDIISYHIYFLSSWPLAFLLHSHWHNSRLFVFFFFTSLWSRL